MSLFVQHRISCRKERPKTIVAAAIVAILMTAFAAAAKSEEKRSLTEYPFASEKYRRYPEALSELLAPEGPPRQARLLAIRFPNGEMSEYLLLAINPTNKFHDFKANEIYTESELSQYPHRFLQGSNRPELCAWPGGLLRIRNTPPFEWPDGYIIVPADTRISIIGRAWKRYVHSVQAIVAEGQFKGQKFYYDDRAVDLISSHHR